MSDLLDMRSPQPEAGPRRRRRLPRAVAVLVALALFLAVAGGVVVGARRLVSGFGTTPDYGGAGSGRQVVQVQEGDSASDIGASLVGAGVVKSRKAFREAAADEPRSRSVQPGFYALRRQMSATAALALLLDPRSRLRSRVTIPEGTPVGRTLELLAKGTEVPIADLRAVVRNPAALGLPAYARNRVEGFLYPATYDVEPGASAVEALTMMVDRYSEAAVEVGLEARARALGITPYQALTVASLTEKEAGVPTDFPKVARAVYNRLHAGMPLQLDSTINYVRAERAARLSLADISVRSPYNSYKNKGLPPTPIDSPGSRALQAALHPATGSYVYFITIDKQGHSLFTTSYQEFLRAKKKAKRDGVY